MASMYSSTHRLHLVCSLDASLHSARATLAFTSVSRHVAIRNTRVSALQACTYQHAHSPPSCVGQHPEVLYTMGATV